MNKRKDIIKICEECKSEYHPWKYTSTVCSKKCQYTRVSKLQTIVALTNNPIKRKEVSEKVWKTRRKNGTDFYGKDHPNYKGGFWINENGYKVFESVKGTGGKKVYEHRAVMEKHIGRKLEKGEHVHHINRDKLDNRIENLELLTASEHSKRHQLEKRIQVCIEQSS